MEREFDFVSSYLKTKRTIETCNAQEHIEPTRLMIDYLSVMCVKINLPFSFYSTYISELKSLLKSKTEEINYNSYNNENNIN